VDDNIYVEIVTATFQLCDVLDAAAQEATDTRERASFRRRHRSLQIFGSEIYRKMTSELPALTISLSLHIS